MPLLILLILMIFLLFNSKKNKNIISKRVVFVYLLWSFIILFVSSLNPYELYNVSSKIYALWILSITIISLTIIIFSNKNRENIVKNNNFNIIKKSKVLLVINIIVLVLLAYFLVRYNRILASASIQDIRNIRFEKLFSTGYEYIIFTYIMQPTLKIIMMLTAISIIYKERKNINVYLGITNIVLNTMIGYGRMCIFEFILFLLFAYLSQKEINKPKIKSIFITLLAIILFAVISTIVTTIRIIGIEGLSIATIKEYGISNQISQLIIYFTGGFRTLDLFISNKIISINDYMFGRLTFAGLEDLISNFTSALGINFIPINNIVGNYTQIPVLIGNNQYFNAFYTSIFNFYGDFGIIGVVFFSFLSGMLIKYSVNNYIKKGNLNSLLLFIYASSMLLCSVYRFNYQLGQYLIILIYLIFINKFKLFRK